MNFLESLTPAWRCRVVGFAIGAPVGLLIAAAAIWMSLR
jgi:hypothetical protein